MVCATLVKLLVINAVVCLFSSSHTATLLILLGYLALDWGVGQFELFVYKYMLGFVFRQFPLFNGK